MTCEMKLPESEMVLTRLNQSKSSTKVVKWKMHARLINYLTLKTDGLSVEEMQNNIIEGLLVNYMPQLSNDSHMIRRPNYVVFDYIILD